MLERHEFSSQSFMPLDVSRWLVVVAPYGADGGPDPSRASAFVAGPGQGVTYHMGTWHHGLTALDRPARFAVFMWRDGTGTDEEFRQLAQPFTVQVPA
jgi:ureidoglycolate lyase